MRQVIDRVRASAEVEFTVIEGSRRPGDSACVIADSSRLREILGWQPRHDDLDVIVNTALAWEKKIR